MKHQLTNERKSDKSTSKFISMYFSFFLAILIAILFYLHLQQRKALSQQQAIFDSQFSAFEEKYTALLEDERASHHELWQGVNHQIQHRAKKTDLSELNDDFKNYLGLFDKKQLLLSSELEQMEKRLLVLINKEAEVANNSESTQLTKERSFEIALDTDKNEQSAREIEKSGTKFQVLEEEKKTSIKIDEYAEDDTSVVEYSGMTNNSKVLNRAQTGSKAENFLPSDDELTIINQIDKDKKTRERGSIRSAKDIPPSDLENGPGVVIKKGFSSISEIVDFLESTNTAKEEYVDSNILTNNFFEQTSEVRNYPIVSMPYANRQVLLPVKGRKNARGVGEKRFQKDIIRAFGNKVKSHFVFPFKHSKYDFEPDYTFADKDFNLFVDIEIDEPYSGVSRKPMHYVRSADADRDTYFNDKGWVVIRFTEWQVVCEPEACCIYIATVVKSLIHPEDFDPTEIEELTITHQQEWSYKEAEQMAEEKYRESYLGIAFKEQAEDENIIEEAFSGVNSNLEDDVLVKNYRERPELSEEENRLLLILQQAIDQGVSVYTLYEGSKKLVKPEKIEERGLAINVQVFNYVTNKQEILDVKRIEQVQIETTPFLEHHEGRSLEICKKMAETANDNDLYLRIRYQKGNGENSIRTLSHFQRDYAGELDDWWYTPSSYIVAYCHLRSENRTFKFNRITEIWLLNLDFEVAGFS